MVNFPTEFAITAAVLRKAHNIALLIEPSICRVEICLKRTKWLGPRPSCALSTIEAERVV